MCTVHDEKKLNTAIVFILLDGRYPSVKASRLIFIKIAHQYFSLFSVQKKRQSITIYNNTVINSFELYNPSRFIL